VTKADHTEDPEDIEEGEIPLEPHHKEGKGCFLVLIVLSAIPVVFFFHKIRGGNNMKYF
jgi:hypothetical protein